MLDEKYTILSFREFSEIERRFGGLSGFTRILFFLIRENPPNPRYPRSIP
jgi:hypothetical protein